MGVQEQLDDLFRQPGGPPGASRRKNFGAKPKLWNAWINLDDGRNGSVNELAEIKPLAVTLVPREAKESKDSSATLPALQPEQERLHERPSAFLAGLFTQQLSLPRHHPENDRSGLDPANSSAEIPRTVQVSVIISMPTPNPTKHIAEEEFPNVAVGFTRLPIAME